MKVALWVLGCIVTLVLIGGVVFYLQVWRTTPLTAAERAELEVDWSALGPWSPWITDEAGERVWNPSAGYNAWVRSVPDEDRAWPALIDVAMERRQQFEPSKAEAYPSGAYPTDDGWDELVEVIQSEDSRRQIDTMAAALRRPVMGTIIASGDRYVDPDSYAAWVEHGIDPGDASPLTPSVPRMNPDVTVFLLPQLGRMRHIARSLFADARVSLVAENDPDRFVELADAVLGSAAHAREVPTVIGQLVEIAVVLFAAENIAWAVESHPERFEDEHLRALDSALASASPIEYDETGETLWSHDLFRRLANDRGAIGPGKMSSIARNGSLGDLGDPTTAPLEKLSADIQRPLLYLGRVHDRIVELCEIPWDPSSPSPMHDWDAERARLGSVPRMLVGMSMPALDSIWHSFQEANQTIVALRLSIAVHRHERRHGAFPHSTDAIDDDLLAFDPVDTFSGDALKLAITEDGPLIYSVGDDRDDDGGAPHREPEFIAPDRIDAINADQPGQIDGDWVLHPTPDSD